MIRPNPSPVLIYTPHSLVKKPGFLIKEMLLDVYRSRELSWRLVKRNLQAQYRQAFFGMTWALLPPTLTAVGLSFASDAGFLNVANTSIPYPAYVMLGTVLWQTFLEAFQSPEIAIKASKPLLSQVKFPHEAIILAQLGQVIFNFLTKLVLVVALFLVLRVPVSWKFIFSPLTLISLVVLGLGLGLILAPITSLVKDISNAMQAIILGWFFLTPVVYPMPEQSVFLFFVKFNPVTPLLVTTRDLITLGTFQNPIAFASVSLLAFALLLVGWLIYKLSIPFLIERIS
ncbi:MAG: lipopolysaccharide transport system permease protein [Phormidesmis priestleyi Ana]|uniref:Transport permease protein n=1 Tax=Phormidesmis priestleyi Ana TaxID=1666911 RepID=A0A0P7Z3N3_9CYAN|nr:MAG: lipopolysaccharide transport system permease protein [Phormidesmis priestleyi Ana]